MMMLKVMHADEVRQTYLMLLPLPLLPLLLLLLLLLVLLVSATFCAFSGCQAVYKLGGCRGPLMFDVDHTNKQVSQWCSEVRDVAGMRDVGEGKGVDEGRS